MHDPVNAPNAAESCASRDTANTFCESCPRPRLRSGLPEPRGALSLPGPASEDGNRCPPLECKRETCSFQKFEQRGGEKSEVRAVPSRPWPVSSASTRICRKGDLSGRGDKRLPRAGPFAGARGGLRRGFRGGTPGAGGCSVFAKPYGPWCHRSDRDRVCCTGPATPGSHLDALDPSLDAELLHQLPGLGDVVSG